MDNSIKSSIVTDISSGIEKNLSEKSLNILKTHSYWQDIEIQIKKWINTPLFFESNNPLIAEHLIQVSIFHTYLFGRYTLPSYMGHICMSLRDIPPIHGNLGNIIRECTELFKGEICTNNIFYESNKDMHAHFYDMLECHEDAGISLEPLLNFIQEEHRKGFKVALTESSYWPKEMKSYAHTIMECSKEPLTTFLLAVISEQGIPEGYKNILDNICPEKRFEKFKTFMRKHIEHDEGEHSPTTYRWLSYYIENFDISSKLEIAIENTLNFLQKRRDSYYSNLS